MTQQALLQSLSTEQGAALNVILEENFTLRGNVETLKTTQSQLAAIQAELATVKAIYEKAKTALASGDMNALKAIHAEAEKPAVQRELEAIDAQLAELQQKKADLAAKL